MDGSGGRSPKGCIYFYKQLILKMPPNGWIWWKVHQRMYLCLPAINIKDVPKWMDRVEGPPRMYLCLPAINIKDVPKWMDLVEGPPMDVFMFTNN